MKKQMTILLVSLCIYIVGVVDYFYNIFHFSELLQIFFIAVPAAFYLRKFVDDEEEFFTFSGFANLLVTLVILAAVIGATIIIVIFTKFSQINHLPYLIIGIGSISLCLQTFRVYKQKK